MYSSVKFKARSVVVILRPLRTGELPKSVLTFMKQKLKCQRYNKGNLISFRQYFCGLNNHCSDLGH